jgi:hypothetical protein
MKIPTYFGLWPSSGSLRWSLAKKICEKWLLALSYLSSCPSTWSDSSPAGWVFMKFDTRVLFESLSWSFIKIWPDELVLYLKTYVHLWKYLTEFFLEWKFFQTNIVEELKTHISYSITSFQKSSWVAKVADTRRISNTYWFSTAATVTWKHCSVKFYNHWLSCWHW